MVSKSLVDILIREGNIYYIYKIEKKYILDTILPVNTLVSSFLTDYSKIYCFEFNIKNRFLLLYTKL